MGSEGLESRSMARMLISYTEARQQVTDPEVHDGF